MIVCASIPRRFPFIGGALALARAWSARRWLVALPFRCCSRSSSRSSSAIPIGTCRRRRPTTTCCRRLTAACSWPARAGRAVGLPAPAGHQWQQVSIFLSPMDVHVNRVPASGRVTRVTLHAGPVSSGVPARRGHGRTSAARSGSTTAARRSWRVRSSACWRAASSAASRTGHGRAAPATGSAS